MSHIGIVTDSTCDLEPEWLAEHDVVMVPLKVLFGEDSYLDWVDLRPPEFLDLLESSPTLPKTSQPSPADFTKAYTLLAEDGVDEIVSIHLTAALSGTYESAHIAAQTSPVPVRVVDTKNVSQATALVVKAALEARDRGADAEEIERVALETTQQTKFFFILNTLDYLVKGGRAGKAAGLAAAMLNLKPILTFNDEGTIEPHQKVKGLRKAMTALAEHVAEESRSGRVRVSVLHACDTDIADQMVAALETAGADYELDSIGLIGAVIGTYAGPKAVGLAYHPVR